LKKIPFNKPVVFGNEIQNLKKTIENIKFSGDGEFSKKCHEWFKESFDCQKALLTTSCSHALDMSAILSTIKPGDEVIMPSFTFVSTANSFALRGAKIVFVDIRPDTMNIDENLIESAINENTKVIVPVHYAGVSCEMKTIMNVAKKNNLFVVEDAAQGILSKYKDKYLGTIGDVGCISFHETKNIQCGEGGAILINNEVLIERAEIIREKGTNRSKFFRGEIDKYTWVDIGSSFLLSEFNAAFLYAQLMAAEKIIGRRITIYNRYKKNLKNLIEKGIVEVQNIPKECLHNGHIFYIKVKNLKERTKLVEFLKKEQIYAIFHYIPLHSSKAGKKFGEFFGEDIYTTKESERLLRLPLFFAMTNDEVDYVSQKIIDFYKR